MNPEIAAVLSIAVAVAVAAIAALWKIAEQVRLLSSEQQTAMHQLRVEISQTLDQSEQRLTRRVEHLEAVSYGFRRHLRGRGDSSDGAGQ